MTAEVNSLAKRLALALIRLLPTADFSDELATRLSAALLDVAARTSPLSRELLESRDALLQADVRERGQLLGDLYTRWRSRFELILTADPDPLRRAELALSVLQATQGVRAWPDPSDPGPGGGTRQRKLRLGCPEAVQLDADFGVTALVAVVGEGSLLKSFPVPAHGRDIVLDLKASGLLIRGPHQQCVRVPPDADSEPVRFELRATRPGMTRISITAWLDGSFLGEVTADVAVSRDAPRGEPQSKSSELRPDPTEGEVSLLARFEPRRNLYRFQFMDSDNPGEVVAPLSWPLNDQLEDLIRRLELATSGETRSGQAESMSQLIDEGALLWRGVLPEKVRHQFWERRDKIKHLSIWSENDRVPWELMYTADAGREAGFLVEQFSLTRDIFDRPGLARRLRSLPARFVLPPDSPPAASREIQFLRELLGAGPETETVMSEFMPLRRTIGQGEFGVLHFACHNFRDPTGSMIKLADAPFTVTNLQSAVDGVTLKGSSPLVFINACRSSEAEIRYNELAGWAEMFLRAGAGAFIGSLWAVRDGSAFRFATNFYEQLKSGRTLGEAVNAGRQAVLSRGQDPAWLAYSVYGDPNSRMASQPDGNR